MTYTAEQLLGFWYLARDGRCVMRTSDEQFARDWAASLNAAAGGQVALEGDAMTVSDTSKVELIKRQ